MAFTVRIFGHRGIEQLHVNNPKAFSSDAIYQLVQPYEWGQALVSNGLTPVVSAPVAAPDATQILRIEVPDGQAIRYEINPTNRTGGAVAAGPNSPILSGINQFYFRQGWTLSIIDAATT